MPIVLLFLPIQFGAIVSVRVCSHQPPRGSTRHAADPITARDEPGICAGDEPIQAHNHAVMGVARRLKRHALCDGIPR
jgi:hypothetical protein